MRRVVFNQKGGVGKSTITCNLAAVAADLGARTLVVDLDSQCNSTQYLLGAEFQPTGPTLADFFDQVLNFKLSPHAVTSFIVPTPFPRLSIMPAHPSLEDLQGKLESRYKIYKLRDALAELITEFDQIWIDTPPALNFFTRSALIAADACLIPFDCDDFSRRAIYNLLANVDEIRSDHNRNLSVAGIVVNQFQARASLPQRIVAELMQEGMPVLEPFLSASIKVRESHEQAQPIIHLDPRHKVALEYRDLYANMISKVPSP